MKRFTLVYLYILYIPPRIMLTRTGSRIKNAKGVCNDYRNEIAEKINSFWHKARTIMPIIAAKLLFVFF